MARGRPARTVVYRRLESALAELRTRLGGLPSPKESEYVWSDIWHLEAHHSTALEGNTLVLREVEVLLEQGRAVGAKPLKEYMEVKGYADAARWVYGQAIEAGDWSPAGLISEQELRHIHHLAMEPVWGVAPHPHATPREAPGNYREHDIRPFSAGMTPPPWPQVPSDVQSWIALVASVGQEHQDGASADRPLPEQLAQAHNAFERVHPFIDGNGRTGRLALNLILVRLGYPPVIVLKRQRPEYLRAMQRADSGEYGPLGELLARAMIDNLNRFILPNIAGPARLLPLAALVDDEISLVALRSAANRGRLDAVMGDAGWLSTRKAVTKYKRSRQHAGRKGRR